MYTPTRDFREEKKNIWFHTDQSQFAFNGLFFHTNNIITGKQAYV